MLLKNDLYLTRHSFFIIIEIAKQFVDYQQKGTGITVNIRETESEFNKRMTEYLQNTYNDKSRGIYVLHWEYESKSSSSKCLCQSNVILLTFSDYSQRTILVKSINVWKELALAHEPKMAITTCHPAESDNEDCEFGVEINGEWFPETGGDTTVSGSCVSAFESNGRTVYFDNGEWHVD